MALLLTGLQELSQLTLMACDQSYAANKPDKVQLGDALQQYPDWKDKKDDIPCPYVVPSGFTVDKIFNDDSSGFKAIAYRKDTYDPALNKTVSEVIIAFAGTDGPDAKDWAADSLYLGWNQWDNNRASVFSYLDGLKNSDLTPYTGKINFTGQSLGGGLAEYATYEFIARADTSQVDALKSRVTLTTFNGFGGQEALSRKFLSAYNPTLLADLNLSAAYYVQNDIVSRLGGGHSGVKSYYLNYDTKVADPAGGNYLLDPISAHRIEPGFYAGYNPRFGFEQATISNTPPQLSVSNTQQIAALWGRIFNDQAMGPVESKFRIAAGICASFELAPRDELRELAHAIIDAYYVAPPQGFLRSRAFLSFANHVDWGNVAAVLPNGKAYVLSMIGALFAQAFDADANGKQIIKDSFKDFLDATLPSFPVFLSENHLLLKENLCFASMGASSNVELNALFENANIDPEKFAQKLVEDSSTDWLSKDIIYLTEQLQLAGKTNNEIIDFNVKLSELTYKETFATGNSDLAFQTYVKEQIKLALADTATAIANTSSSFLERSSAELNLGTTTDFIAYDKLHDELEEISNESHDIKFLVKEALKKIEKAGEQIVLLAGRPTNPFAAEGYSPEAQALPTADLKENGAKLFTIYLPYAAQIGGQAMKLLFQGADVSKLTIRNGDVDIAPVNGEFDLTILENRRDLTFQVFSIDDIDTDLTYQIKATLVDAAGTATHTQNLEANLNLDAFEEPMSYQLILGSDLEDDTNSPQLGHGNTLLTTDTAQEIQALDGNDRIVLRHNTTRAYGGNGNDILITGDNTHTNLQHILLDGGLGDDLLVGETGDDTLNGGDDNDWIGGGIGADIINGGDGADQILAGGNLTYISLEGDGDDIVKGGAGDDLIWGGEGTDLLMGEADNDQLSGDSEGDLLYGGTGDDILIGDGTYDPANPNTPYTLAAFHGNDTLDGGDGNDQLIGDGGDDQLIGGAGDDTLIGDNALLNTAFHGKDYLDGGDGADKLYGNSDDDQLFGGAGNDELQGGEGADYLDGEADDDKLFGEAGDDELFGGAGTDQLSGGDGDDYLDGEDDDDLILGDAGNDQLFGGAGADQLQGGDGDDTLDGEADDDILFGEADKDILLGGAGEDELHGGEDNDQLFGGTDDDILVGDESNDTLQGDAGNDSLLGGAGDDLYIVNLGDGNDALDDTEGLNKIQFGAGITPASLQISVANGADGFKYLILQYSATDSIAIKEGFNGNSIKLYQFADGSTLTHTELLTDHSIQAYNETGTSNDDLLAGGAYNDTLNGADGNDTLMGGAGNDALNGGLGTDTYIMNASFGQDTITLDDYTNQATDTLQFGPGILPNNLTASRSGNHLTLKINGTTDQLTVKNYFSFTNNTFLKAQFTDSSDIWDITQINQRVLASAITEGNDNIQGFNTDDIINGLGGDDQLYGNAGNDILNGGIGNDGLQGGLGNDTYIFNLNEGNDYIWEGNPDVADNIDTIKMGAGILSTDVKVTRGIEGNPSDLVFTLQSNGQTLTIDNFFSNYGPQNKIERVEFADGTTWDLPTLRGFIENGTAGNDNLIGYNDHDDLIDGLSGDDRIQGLNGNDTLNGGAGRDTLEGGLGDDTLDGGTGRDILRGDAGNDTYLINRNSGTDFIIDTVTSIDTILLAADIVPADLTLTRYNDALLLNINGSSVQTVIQNHFADTQFQIEQIQFANGTTWNLADINARVITPVANALTGTSSNDTFNIDHIGDTITENLNAGTDTVNSKINYTLPTNVENINLIGPFAFSATGNTLNNTITGNEENNTLDGGAGADTMIGGEGDDFYYVDNAGDIVIENTNEGTDTLTSTVTYTLSANVENLTLNGSAYIDGTGNELNNVLTGNNRDNRLDGGLGADTMKGGAGSDTYVIDNLSDLVVENFNEGASDTIESNLSYTLSANVERLLLTGSANINGTAHATGGELIGNSGDNILTGNAGFNQLEGKSGNDTLLGGVDGDAYVFNLGDGQDTIIDTDIATNIDTLTFRTPITPNDITFNQNGNDLILHYSASDQITIKDWFISDTHRIEQIYFSDGTIWDAPMIDAVISGVFMGTAGDDLLNGTSANNILIGLAGNDIIDGKGGADQMTGGAGNDTYFVDNINDVVTENANEGTDTINSAITTTLGANIENLNLSGTANLNGTGNTLNNVINGNVGDNRLDGGLGNDTLRGGLGNDTYIVNTSSDIITENINEGTDTVESSVTYTLGANVENLTLTGAAAINGTGNSLNNTLQGNSGVNTLSGGTGNDTYIISTGDIVIENASAGTDTVITDITYTLGTNIENLTLSGTANINATGNSSANILIGNSGNNTLNGGSGADNLSGGLGNDTYTVDNTGDVIVENVNEGTDTVNSSVTYTLTANIENLTLTGTAAINGTGNASDNILTGNSAVNTLTGGAGNDTLDGLGGNDQLRGGLGDDTYIFGTGDVITENANEGTDTVKSSATYTLGTNVENLILTGTSAINGTGNTLNNVITGNSANNTLIGNAGNDILDGNGGTDTLRGGTGDDIYFIDGTSDIVTENASEGTDTVNSSVTLTLGTNVENLNLTGTANINGTGNTLNNVLNGNSGNNTLTGAAGNDTLAGGTGTDTLNGGTGNDIYKMNRGDGADTIIDNDTTAGNKDTAQFGTNIGRDQLWFKQTGNNLEVSVIGTADKLIIQDWTLGAAHHVEEINTWTGSTLLENQFQNLINAMAGFAPPPMGQTTLSPDYQEALLPIIVASWS